MFWSSMDLVNHLEQSVCDVNALTSDYFKPKEDGIGDYVEVMDNLKFFQVINISYFRRIIQFYF